MPSRKPSPSSRTGTSRRAGTDPRRGIFQRPALEVLEDRVPPGDLLSLGLAFVNLPAVTTPAAPTEPVQVLVIRPADGGKADAGAQAPLSWSADATAAGRPAPAPVSLTAAAIASLLQGTLPGAALAGEAVEDPWADPLATGEAKAGGTRAGLPAAGSSQGGSLAGGAAVDPVGPAVNAAPGSPGVGTAGASGDLNQQFLDDVSRGVVSFASGAPTPAGTTPASPALSSAAAPAAKGATPPASPAPSPAAPAGSAAPATGTVKPSAAPRAATPPAPSTPGRPAPLPIIATGADAGAPPLVKVFDAITGAEKFEFLAYDASFRGGVRVATADLSGDGIPDIVTAPGPGMAPQVRIFDGRTGAPFDGWVNSFLAYDASFRGGVFIALGKAADGFNTDIITAPGDGGGSAVKVFSPQATLLLSFNAYGPGFDGGVHVASARFPGKGHDDIITAPAGAGAPVVHVFDGQTGVQVAGPLGSFLAYEPTYLGGVFVAAGDTNDDSTPDIITGPGIGHSPEVKVFSGAGGAVLRDFQAFGPLELGGVRVASAYIDNDPYADIVTAEGIGGEPRMRVFSGASGAQLPPPVGNFLAYPADQRTGGLRRRGQRPRFYD